MDRLVLRLERLPDGKHHYEAERYYYPEQTPSNDTHENSIRNWVVDMVREMSIELNKQEKRDRGFVGWF